MEKLLNNKRMVWLFFGIILAVTCICNSQFQLQSDEAYYWVWSQRPALSYYDHPPMVAYLIWLSTKTFGNSEFFVRLPAVVCFAVTGLFLYKLANHMFGNKVAIVTLVLVMACPILEGVSFVITPDTPFLTFWVLTLYCFYRGIFENNTLFLYFAGFFAGCDLLSKYPAVLIFPSLFMFLVCSKKYRCYFKNPHLYFAFVFTLIVFSPVIIWNFQNKFASFAFQSEHGMGKFLSFVPILDIAGNFFNYVGILLLIASPVACVALFYYGIKYFKFNFSDDKCAFLAWNFAFGFLFLGVCGLFNKLEANWAAPICISALVLLAYYLEKFKKQWVSTVSFVLMATILVVARMPNTLFFFLPIARNMTGADRIFYYGTKEMLLQAKPYIKPNSIVLGCDYQNAALAWYYLKLPKTDVITDTPLQFRYWEDGAYKGAKEAIFICNNSFHHIDLKRVFKENFSNVELLKVAMFSNHIADYRTSIYKVEIRNFKAYYALYFAPPSRSRVDHKS